MSPPEGSLIVSLTGTRFPKPQPPCFERLRSASRHVKKKGPAQSRVEWGKLRLSRPFGVLGFDRLEAFKTVGFRFQGLGFRV